MTQSADIMPSDLRDLRYVQHFCIFALRASVSCSPKCRILLREFDRAFGGDVGDGFSAYLDLVQSLGKGRRKVAVGRPGHVELTHDERTLLALLAAAQDQDRARFAAHACFFMGHNRLDRLYDDARAFTGLLRNHGHFFAKPKMEALQEAAFQASLSVAS